MSIGWHPYRSAAFCGPLCSSCRSACGVRVHLATYCYGYRPLRSPLCTVTEWARITIHLAMQRSKASIEWKRLLTCVCTQMANSSLGVVQANGVIGTPQFLEGHYLLLVTKRQYQGSLCGHKIYSVSDTALVPLSQASAQVWRQSALVASNMA